MHQAAPAAVCGAPWMDRREEGQRGAILPSLFQEPLNVRRALSAIPT
jgi:hypothetical protein